MKLKRNLGYRIPILAREESARTNARASFPLSGLGLFLGGALFGSFVTFLLDPQQGRRRRALARDKAVSLQRDTSFYGGKIARDLRNRAEGLSAVASKAMSGEEGPVDDKTLVDRVRSAMGRVVSHTRAVDVEARNGEVTLRGPILDHEVDRLMDTVSRVSGVERVVNALDARSEPGNTPSLQGEGKEYLQ